MGNHWIKEGCKFLIEIECKEWHQGSEHAILGSLVTEKEFLPGLFVTKFYRPGITAEEVTGSLKEDILKMIRITLESIASADMTADVKKEYEI